MLLSHLALTLLAAEELVRAPTIARWVEGDASGKVPLLYYYHRCYSTLNDGTTVEHGDGIGLTLVDQSGLQDTDEIAFEKVALPDGRSVFVRIPRSLLTSDVSIGWSNEKFTLETPKPR